MSFQEALDGLELPDIPSVSVPVDLELPGVDSPLQGLIDDANRITDVATEVTDAGKSFADLRGEVGATELKIADLDTEFGNVLDTVVDVKAASTGFFEDLLLLSDNAPTILGGLFSALDSVDSRFGDISAFVQGIASGNPVAVFSALPGLQQAVQDLLSPVGVSEADVQRDRAIQARQQIAESALSGAHQVDLTQDLDFLIRELTIRYIRSFPEAYANATIGAADGSAHRAGH